MSLKRRDTEDLQVQPKSGDVYAISKGRMFCRKKPFGSHSCWHVLIGHSHFGGLKEYTLKIRLFFFRKIKAIRERWRQERICHLLYRWQRPRARWNESCALIGRPKRVRLDAYKGCDWSLCLKSCPVDKKKNIFMKNFNEAKDVLQSDSTRNGFRTLRAGRIGEFHKLSEPVRSQDL